MATTINTYRKQIPRWKTKVIIYGPSELDDFLFIKDKLDNLTKKFLSPYPITGHRTGFDRLVHSWSFRNTLDYSIEHSQEEIFDRAGKDTRIIIFWDCSDYETRQMIRKVRKKRLRMKLVLF